MTVVKHESNTKNVKKSFCYDSGIDTLQYSEEILNNLTTVRNNDVPKYKHFENEMEKIDGGDTSNEAAVKLDEYFGDIGVDEDSHTIIEKGRQFNGIC